MSEWVIRCAEELLAEAEVDKAILKGTLGRVMTLFIVHVHDHGPTLRDALAPS
jgi:hypothetical protein